MLLTLFIVALVLPLENPEVKLVVLYTNIISWYPEAGIVTVLSAASVIRDGTSDNKAEAKTEESKVDSGGVVAGKVVVLNLPLIQADGPLILST